jgi:hypothetical protein
LQIYVLVTTNTSYLYYNQFIKLSLLLLQNVTNILLALMKYRKTKVSSVPAPMIGELAEIDQALLVTPPKGMEIGYVPVVTRQGIE